MKQIILWSLLILPWATLSTITIVAMMVGFSVIIYLYQLWQDEVFKQPKAKLINDQELT